MIKALLNGSRGQMGVTIKKNAAASGVAIAAELDLGIALPESFEAIEVGIDFSVPSGTESLLPVAVSEKIPLVVGTTGHSKSQLQQIHAAAQSIPIVLSGNYSIGVNLLFTLARITAQALGPEFDPELIEVHHRKKKDSPSGTAVQLLEIIEAVRNWPNAVRRPGRDGWVGERPEKEIGIHSVRGGDVVGDHTLLFAGPGERIELTHRATDRAIFAHGALRAAGWVLRQEPGLYSMEDVLTRP